MKTLVKLEFVALGRASIPLTIIPVKTTSDQWTSGILPASYETGTVYYYIYMIYMKGDKGLFWLIITIWMVVIQVLDS